MTGNIKCKSCSAAIKYESFHLGFSGLIAFYCSSCSIVLLIDDFNSEQCKDLHKELSQNYGRENIPYWNCIASQFKPCKCGGKFDYLNPPRCPKCNGLICGDIYESKPVLKEIDRYVIITSESIKGSTWRVK